MGKTKCLHDLRDVLFAVARGSILGLIGPNGAGKTTMFNCVAGLYRPTDGRIVFAGEGEPKDVAGTSPERMTALGVARTFQNIRLFASLTVLDNVRIGRHCRTRVNFFGAVLRTRSQRAEERRSIDDAMECLDFVSLGDAALAPAASLAYGDQRRLEIARALATDPRLLLLDEPALGLAPLVVENIFEIIQQINAEGVTVLLVEQNAQMALHIAHRGYVLETGRVTLEGPAAELLDNPRVRSAYLGLD